MQTVGSRGPAIGKSRYANEPANHVQIDLERCLPELRPSRLPQRVTRFKQLRASLSNFDRCRGALSGPDGKASYAPTGRITSEFSLNPTSVFTDAEFLARPCHRATQFTTLCNGTSTREEREKFRISLSIWKTSACDWEFQRLAWYVNR